MHALHVTNTVHSRKIYDSSKPTVNVLYEDSNDCELLFLDQPSEAYEVREQLTHKPVKPIHDSINCM